MKISYSEYIKKANVSALVAESIFSDLLTSSDILKIENVAKTTSGGTPNRSNPDYYNGEIPWLKSGELNDGIINSSEEFITEEGLRNSSAKLHPEGTLLVAMYGATAGKVGILNLKVSTNQAVCAVYPNEKVERDYLFWFFRSHRFQYIEKSKGGAQPNISQSVINDTLIPVPDKELQANIAKLLFQIEREGTVNLEIVPEQFRDSVYKVLSFKNAGQDIANELTHQLSLVKSLRQQLLQDAVQGKLVAQHPDDEPASTLLEKIKAEKEKLIAEKKLKKEKLLPPIKPEEIPFEIPEGWVWCRLGEIALHSEAGKSYQALDLIAQANQIGVIKTSAITSSFFLEDENKLLPNQNINIDKIKIEKGDLIFCRASGSKGLAGKACLVERTPKAQLVLSDKSIRYVLSNNINKKFLQNINSSAYGEEYYMSLGTKKSTTMNNITREQFNSFPIPLPPLPEQTRIVQKLEELMQYCDGLEVGIRESMVQNERLLQQVLREALRQ